MSADPHRARKQIDKIDHGDFRLVPALHSPAPPPPAPTFDVVPVAALTSRGQRFRCSPYHAVLSAGTCADRQGERATNRGTRTTRAQYECCLGCALGAAVAARLGAL